jgi:hypothetical protein
LELAGRRGVRWLAIACAQRSKAAPSKSETTITTISGVDHVPTIQSTLTWSRFSSQHREQHPDQDPENEGATRRRGRLGVAAVLAARAFASIG